MADYEGVEFDFNTVYRVPEEYGEQDDGRNKTVWGDIAYGAGVGALDLAETSAGLVDLAAHALGSDKARATEWIEKVGVGEAKKLLQERYSTETQQARMNMARDEAEAKARGMGEVGQAVAKGISYLQNPRLILVDTAESLPSMFAGGGVGGIASKAVAKRAISKGIASAVANKSAATAARVGSSIGEGVIGGGSVAKEIIADNREHGRGDFEGANAAWGAMLSDAAIAGVGNKLGSVDATLWSKAARTERLAKEGAGIKAAIKGITKATVAEGLTEGMQSASETGFTNYGTGKPISEGMGASFGQGVVAGGVMGGVGHTASRMFTKTGNSKEMLSNSNRKESDSVPAEILQDDPNHLAEQYRKSHAGDGVQPVQTPQTQTAQPQAEVIQAEPAGATEDISQGGVQEAVQHTEPVAQTQAPVAQTPQTVEPVQNTQTAESTEPVATSQVQGVRSPTNVRVNVNLAPYAQGARIASSAPTASTVASQGVATQAVKPIQAADQNALNAPNATEVTPIEVNAEVAPTGDEQTQVNVNGLPTKSMTWTDADAKAYRAMNDTEKTAVHNFDVSVEGSIGKRKRPTLKDYHQYKALKEKFGGDPRFDKVFNALTRGQFNAGKGAWSISELLAHAEKIYQDAKKNSKTDEDFDANVLKAFGELESATRTNPRQTVRADVFNAGADAYSNEGVWGETHRDELVNQAKAEQAHTLPESGFEPQEGEPSPLANKVYQALHKKAHDLGRRLTREELIDTVYSVEGAKAEFGKFNSRTWGLPGRKFTQFMAGDESRVNEASGVREQKRAKKSVRAEAINKTVEELKQKYPNRKFYDDELTEIAATRFGQADPSIFPDEIRVSRDAPSRNSPLYKRLKEKAPKDYVKRMKLRKKYEAEGKKPENPNVADVESEVETTEHGPQEIEDSTTEPTVKEEESAPDETVDEKQTEPETQDNAPESVESEEASKTDNKETQKDNAKSPSDEKVKASENADSKKAHEAIDNSKELSAVEKAVAHVEREVADKKIEEAGKMKLVAEPTSGNGGNGGNGGGNGNGNNVGRTIFPETDPTKGMSPVAKNKANSLYVALRKKIDKHVKNETMRSTLNSIVEFVTQRGFGLYFTRDLIESTAKLLPSARTWQTLMERAIAYRTNIEAEFAKVNRAFNDLEAHERSVVNELVRDMTISEVWAYHNKEFFKTAEAYRNYLKSLNESQLAQHKEMKAKFDSLSPEAQAVIEAVHNTWRKVNYLHAQAMEEKLKKFHERYENSAKNPIAREEARKRHEQELKAIFAEADKKTPPYSPLGRMGSHVVIVRSRKMANLYDKMQMLLKERQDPDFTYTEGKDINEEISKIKKEIEKLETQEDHYVFQMKDSLGDANESARALAERYPDHDIQVYEKSEVRDAQVPAWVQIQALLDTINDASQFGGLKNEFDPAKAQDLYQEMETRLSELYIKVLNESSARKNELRRRKIAGFHEDMMESFVHVGKAQASYIAQIRFGQDTNRALSNMAMERGELRGPEQEVASLLMNEVIRHHNLANRPSDSKFVGTAMQVSSFYMLMLRPSYYIANMTQPFMMSAPYIAKDFGSQAFGRMTDNMRIVGELVAKGAVTIEDMRSVLTEDEYYALKKAAAQGHIDVGMSLDMGRIEGTGAVSRTLQKMGDKLQAVSRNAETINRVATFLTAYQLAKEQGNFGDIQAFEYADNAVYRTHGDYSGFNSPRYFNMNGMARLMTQFKKFQLIQISMMNELLKKSFAGASREERIVARKALAFTMMTHFAMAGVKGMPLIGTMLSILPMVFGEEGDDDEDVFRRVMHEAGFSKTFANAMWSGFPTLFGVDVSKKVGASDMLNPMPFVDINLHGGKASANELVAAALGPSATIFQRMYSGMGDLIRGNYLKGLEKVLPNGVSDSIKAYRFTTEGITSSGGDLLMPPEDYHAFDAIMRAMGSPSLKETDRTRAINAYMRHKENFAQQKQMIVDQYKKASKAGDRKELAHLEAEWIKLSVEMRKQEFPALKVKDLRTYVKNQRKRERQAQNEAGTLPVPKNHVKAVQRILEM